NISTLDGLAAAAKAGRLRSLKGMGAKKEAQILKAIEERAKDAGRHLLTETAATAADLVSYLQSHAPDVEFIPVGSLRRGCETCGDIDIVAVGGDVKLMDVFVAHPKVEQVLGQGTTKSSVKLAGSYQAHPPCGPARQPRGGDAVLHRLQGAQHRGSRSRHSARLQTERVRPFQDRHRRE